MKTFSLLCFVIIFVNIYCQKTFSDKFVSKSRLGIFKESAVSTDAADCASVGKEILEINGTAADAIISVVLCMGVTIQESTGLGGGGLIVFYNRTTKQSYAIDAREVAPKAAKRDMFANNRELSEKGPLSIAVPGALAGFWELHQRSGQINWNRLFDGAIRLGIHGFKVSQHMANAIKLNENIIKNHSSLREIYLNPKTNEIYRENDTIIQTKLAQTLQMLANSNHPLKLFYEGIIAQHLVQDIKDANNEWNISEIISLEDFKNYKIEFKRNVIKTLFKRGNMTLHTMPLSGTGILLSFIMKVMENFDDLYPNAFKSLNTSVLFYHRLIETFKFGFSRRMLLGDDRFEDVIPVMTQLSSQSFIDSIHNKIDDSQTYDNPGHYGAQVYMSGDEGTSHVSVIDKYGNAASLSSTVNMYFGSKVLSKRTGIILNDEMDDFSSNFTNSFGVPPSNHNYIEPLKRPLSSMCPSIFVDCKGNAKLVIGASGGTKITTAVATVAIRSLWMNETIKEAIDWPRIHHQLFPNEVEFEPDFPRDILLGLQKLGHKTKSLDPTERGAIVMALDVVNNQIEANSDYRKGGEVDGI